MKPLITALMCLAIPAAWTADAKLKIEPVKTIITKGNERLYRIKDGTASINDLVIIEFSVRDDVSVAYKNKTGDDIGPKYTVRIYNRYGFLLTEEEEEPSAFGGSYLDPGELGGDTLHVDWIPLTKIFSQTRYQLPADFDKPWWLMPANNNTLPAAKPEAE